MKHLADRIMNIPATLGLSLLFICNTAHAHEYWLDPIDSSITRGSSAIIDVRNGENFAGAAHPFDDSKFESIFISSEDTNERYKGRLGDYPAIHPELNTDGLHSINVTTTPKLLTYQSWDKFNTFLQYHALDTIADQHKQRNLPTTEIKERYFRSAKTLIQVNSNGELTLDDSTPTDVDNNQVFSASGAVFELLLLDNPYSVTDTVRIKLLYQAKPLGGRQVELFWKGSSSSRFTANTDDDGIATFKLMGAGDYLLNSVKVTEPASDDVHWLSYWASMTFER